MGDAAAVGIGNLQWYAAGLCDPVNIKAEIGKNKRKSRWVSDQGWFENKQENRGCFNGKVKSLETILK